MIKLAKKFTLGTSLSKLLTVTTLTLGLAIAAQAAWPQIYTGSASEFDESHDIACDAEGNIFVLGTVQNLLTGYDFVTIKYNRFGAKNWVRTWNYAGSSDDRAVALALDPMGNVAVTGYTTGPGANTDFVTLRYDNDGNLLWSALKDAPFGGNDFPVDVVCDSLGNIAVTGTAATAGFGQDFMTVRYTADGTSHWRRTYTGAGQNADEPRAIAVDANDNFFVTGRTLNGGNYYDYATIKYGPLGSAKWIKKFNSADSSDDATAIEIAPNGDVVVVGTSEGPNGTSDVLAIKYANLDGAKIWQRRIGNGSIYESAANLAVSASGDVYIVGNSGQDGEMSDVLTIKLDEDGAKQWVRIFTADPQSFSGDVGVDIDVDSLGNVYVAAALRENNSSAGSLFGTLKYSATGHLIWDQRFGIGGIGSAVPTALVVDKNLNRVYVTGFAYNTGGSQFDIATVKY